MFGRIAAFLVFLLASSSILAQTTIPTVQVIGMRISEVSICGGSSCSSLFPMPQIVPPNGQFIELEDVGPDDETPACDPDGTVREGAVWAAYQAGLIRRHGNSAIGRIRAELEDRQNWGQTMTIFFSNGSIGLYERTDSELGSSHGFIEMQAPACAAP